VNACPFSWWSPGFGERIQCAGFAGHTEPHRGRSRMDRTQDRTAAFVAVGAEFAVPEPRWFR
jgi:hypothetical protein